MVGVLCSALVVLEKSSESLSARDFTAAAGCGSFDEAIPKALVIALPTVVGYEFGVGSTERPLPEEDELVEALGLDREHESLREGVGVSCRLHSIRTLSSDVVG